MARAAASGQRSALFQREMFDPSPEMEAPFDVANMSPVVINIFVPVVSATTQEFPIENRRWPPPFPRQIPKRQTLSLIVIIFVNDMIPPAFLSITKIKLNDVDQLYDPTSKSFLFLQLISLFFMTYLPYHCWNKAQTAVMDFSRLKSIELVSMSFIFMDWIILCWCRLLLIYSWHYWLHNILQAQQMMNIDCWFFLYSYHSAQ